MEGFFKDQLRILLEDGDYDRDMHRYVRNRKVSLIYLYEDGILSNSTCFIGLYNATSTTIKF